MHAFCHDGSFLTTVRHSPMQRKPALTMTDEPAHTDSDMDRTLHNHMFPLTLSVSTSRAGQGRAGQGGAGRGGKQGRPGPEHTEHLKVNFQGERKHTRPKQCCEGTQTVYSRAGQGQTGAGQSATAYLQLLMSSQLKQSPCDGMCC